MRNVLKLIDSNKRLNPNLDIENTFSSLETE